MLHHGTPADIFLIRPVCAPPKPPSKRMPPKVSKARWHSSGDLSEGVCALGLSGTINWDSPLALALGCPTLPMVKRGEFHSVNYRNSEHSPYFRSNFEIQFFPFLIRGDIRVKELTFCCKTQRDCRN